MIPGLNIDSATESRIWAAFSNWAEHFKVHLKSGGMQYLLSEYEKLVSSVETQSCNHGPFGRRLTGKDWQDCCGISYEYTNDISIRSAIEIILLNAKDHVDDDLKEKIASLDNRLFGLYENRPPRSGQWWHQDLPRGIVE
jgi:hypothetical protein